MEHTERVVGARDASGELRTPRRARVCARVARRARGPSRGQALVEAALGLPVIFTLAIGIADGSQAFSYKEAVSNAARQTLRLAASSGQQSTGDHACALAGGSATSASLTAHIPYIAGTDDSTMQTMANAAALESSTDGTPAGSRLNKSTTTVQITWHCASSKAVTNSSNGGVTDPASTGSDSIEVKVSYALTLLTPFASTLFGGSPTVSSDFVGRTDY